jgi:hypothetical protein
MSILQTEALKGPLAQKRTSSFVILSIGNAFLYVSILLHYNVYIQFPSIMQLSTLNFLPLTQQVSAADGHPQVFHYAKPDTLHLVLSNPCVCLNIL